ncbi:MAG: carbon storage regulator [Gammaproteobacteria bacterium]|nr:carbon storage regulator [Gammaproteobacteria bacterium]
MRCKRVKLGIDTPDNLTILRDEIAQIKTY